MIYGHIDNSLSWQVGGRGIINIKFLTTGEQRTNEGQIFNGDNIIEKPVPAFDGKMEWKRKEGNVPNKKVSVVAKSIVKAVVEKQLNELATMMDTLYLTDKDGKPIGSGWKIQTINMLCVDIFQTRDIRGSSYIETPCKFKHAKCGLANIQKHDQQCLKKRLYVASSGRDEQNIIG